MKRGLKEMSCCRVRPPGSALRCQIEENVVSWPQAHVSVFQPGVSRQARRTATTLFIAYAWNIVTVRGTIFFGLDLILEIPLFLYLEVGGRGKGR